MKENNRLPDSEYLANRFSTPKLIVIAVFLLIFLISGIFF